MLTKSQEKGAFEALEKQVLRAIQINISEQEDKPNHVVESYTFTFSYQTSPEGAKTLADVTMQDPSGTDTTVKNVKYALHMFIRKIIALCETLPELPGMSIPLTPLIFHRQLLTQRSKKIPVHAAVLYR